MSKKSAIVVGATGLVGMELVKELLSDNYYDTIITISRKPLQFQNDKLVQYVVDFEKLKDYKELLSANDIYCCLGTTMKTAGSKEKFYKVDYSYPLEFAQMAAKNKAEKFVIVTAMGANKNSSVYYNKVKGEIEEAVSKIGIPSVYILRPSLLLGERTEERKGEKFAQKASGILKFVLIGPFAKYKPIKATVVAKAMKELGKKAMPGVHVFSSDKIEQLSA